MSDTVSADTITQVVNEHLSYFSQFIHQNIKMGDDGNPHFAVQYTGTVQSPIYPYDDFFYTYRETDVSGPHHIEANYDMTVHQDGDIYDYKGSFSYNASTGAYNEVTQSFFNGEKVSTFHYNSLG